MPPQPKNGTACKGCPHLEVHKWSKGTRAAVETLPTRDIQNIFSTGDWEVVIIFTSANSITTKDCSECRNLLSSTFAIPKIWWAECYRKAIGYFGREDSVSSEGRLTGISTWSRFTMKMLERDKLGNIIYHWRKFNLCTRWLPNGRQAIIAFDPRPEVKEAVSGLLEGLDAQLLQDPFWIFIVVGQEVLDSQHKAIWGMRGLVRDTEKKRERDNQTPMDFPKLHDLARHAIHISETMDLCALSMDEIISHQKQFWAARHRGGGSARVGDAARSGDAAAAAATTKTQPRDGNGDDDEGNPQDLPPPPAARQVRHRLQFHHNALRSMLLRAAANRERLQNEIGLAFNTVAQRDARTSVDISRATREDGMAMKTLALVTVAFLPATFICAVFSMSFFNFSPDSGRWVVSDMFWVYWAVTVPVTVCTALFFMWWSRPKPKLVDGKVRAGTVSAWVDNSLATLGLARVQRGDTDLSRSS
ncbi:hypothetical protein GGTG_00527 [Gaeumannomyces tritici R3-111a-1]|uniref:Uncharacterized protein n=1 Tax=Gaeumannomyces tritici (strain R3-111a-1) TaxID=644352 RepID=J3NGZ1_GAET3|nr:hypothetical protein GGTG_00527 [Gaeumannomyces tritici R3-111a-1]EJT80531.1 hypothetical protein GGTG_00527 [Gaeumannomyces tritici R3-111a-1]